MEIQDALESLETAIETTEKTNDRAVAALEAAMDAAFTSGLSLEDHRYKYAHKLLAVCLRTKNLMGEFSLANRRYWHKVGRDHVREEKLAAKAKLRARAAKAGGK
jgi:hypothetical protein